jgi:hypothetical protein
MAPHRFTLADCALPGSPTHHAERVEACVGYTTVMVATENDYHSRGLIAITVCDDSWFHITRNMVREVVSQWLGTPQSDIDVEFYPPKGFLILLALPDLRDRALSANSGILIGHAKLQLFPWSRMASAEASKLFFKVRLCVEGIPHHARQEAAVRRLLPNDALLECIDYNYHNDIDANYCCIIIWARDSDLIALEGSLRLEELQDRPHAAWHFADESTVCGAHRRAQGQCTC